MTVAPTQGSFTKSNNGPVRRWKLIVVRAWTHEDGMVIRMTMSTETGPVTLTEYTSSSRAAGDRLAQWLDIDSAPEPSRRDDSGNPTTGGVDAT